MVSITAQRVGVRDAHVAASVRAGSGVPLVRGVSVGGPRHVIGRRSRPRGVGEITAIGRRRSAIGLSAIRLASRATVSSTGISSRRAIGWRRSVGWRRAVAWGRSAILCICLHDPRGRSQNAYSCDGDQSASHRYLLCFDESAAEVMHAQRRARSNIKPSLYRRQRVSVVSGANENPAQVWQFPKGGSGGVSGIPHREAGRTSIKQNTTTARGSPYGESNADLIPAGFSCPVD